ncbi:MAG: hypothetical protein QOH46_397 [Solirubrobacteraceae bacterium]|nr:hypothetical protein [Solirubrobacteraceae bacterium]
MAEDRNKRARTVYVALGANAAIAAAKPAGGLAAGSFAMREVAERAS